jgi:hypothetical protein
MPVKAPPPPAPPPLDIHGFVEWDWESFLINPQGQALVNHSTGTMVAGLDWNIYKNKGGFINSVSVGGGMATDWSSNFPGYWGSFGPSANGDLFDAVFFVDQSVTFGTYWTLSDTFYNVYSGDVAGSAAAAATSLGGAIGFPFLNFNELKIALNDSFTGWPITFNPYVTWYYEFNGGGVAQPACFDCQVGSDFTIGMTPTMNMSKWWGVPLTLKAPTYVTVGPSSFWGGNAAAGAPGVVPGSPGSSGGIGVFSTGLTGIWSLAWVPANYGHWYVKGGFQWYDIINANLVASNAFSICGLAFATCSSSATKSVFVGFAGLGVGF